jgi:hypothetical protein
LIIKIVTSPVPLAHKQNPEIPMALSEVIAKAMAKLPQERYADAGEMQRAMHTAAESQLGELRRTLSDLPPASLTIPEDGIPIQRERSMLSREFPLGSTQDDLAAAGLATNDDDDDDDELGTDDDGPITTPNAHSEPIEVPSLPPTTGEFTARLSGRKRRPWLWPMVLLIAGGSLAFVVMRPEPEQIKTSTVAVPPVTKVTLRLRELPADATFTIDGEPVSGDSAELPKDGKARTLRVRAPGKQDWQAVYTASADWTYDVVLPDLPNAPAPEPTAAAPSAAPASPVAGTTEPAVAKPKHPASSAPVSATPARKAGKRKSPSALRDLDF